MVSSAKERSKKAIRLFMVLMVLFFVQTEAILLRFKLNFLKSMSRWLCQSLVSTSYAFGSKTDDQVLKTKVFSDRQPAKAWEM